MCLVYTVGDRTHNSVSRLVLCKYFYIPEKKCPWENLMYNSQSCLDGLKIGLKDL